MRKKTIKVRLTSDSIDNAIKELEDFKEWVEEKTQTLAYELAKRGVEIADIKFKKAIYDGTNDVEVIWDDVDEYKAVVIAKGHRVFFIEFGTGVKYPDDHPEKPEGLLGRGEFGNKHGSDPEGWDYMGYDKGTNGEIKYTAVRGTELKIIHTYGNPANQCMYRTVRDLQDIFEEVVRRVFND